MSTFPPIPAPLPAERLRAVCDLEGFDFGTTADLEEHSGDLGQERAMEALHFGLSIEHPDYHVYVLGEDGCGKHATAFRLLRERAASQPTPPDLCYVHNFDEPLHPELLTLPAGRGAAFRADMQSFVRDLRPAIEAALESAPYREQVEALLDAHKAREDAALCEIDEFPDWHADLRKATAKATREALTPVLAHLLREMRARYADLPVALKYFDALEKDVLDTAMSGAAFGGEMEEIGAEDAAYTPPHYQVKLLVDHSRSSGAPIVFEDNPGYGNLIGRIEHVMHQGAQHSYLSLIRSGALHRANGGYLVVDAERLFAQPYAWEGLKRSLRSGEIRIEAPAEFQDWSGALTLEPQPAPCTLKVVMIGEREIYYDLMERDPVFAELFKVPADFSDDLPRSPQSEREYARLLALLVRAAKLLPLDRAAVGRMVEEGARIAEDAGRLSLRTRLLSDLMREADHAARQDHAACIGRAHIETALAARARRVSHYPERVRESMLDGSTLIATSGARAGQINGLVVVELAGEGFGYPVRISATVRLGNGDVVDIERESELGGAIHSKGVMILSAFLAARYARHQPLSLSASIVVEQSYGPIEGDSASLAELCALLSALTRLPIEQRFAITGSVNQFGEVQTIGGVNEKIEGFFDLCAARGLDGSHGVVIPAASARGLMLREDVVEAARAGRFHIIPVNTVDEAMTVLTGVPAGEADARGLMPKDSVNDRAARALADMTLASHAHANGQGGKRRGNRE
jgi:lon-related putative ATP-dependent protease